MAQYFPTINEVHKRLPIYLNTVGIDYEETEVNRPNGFPAYQWIQCIHGSGIFKYEHKEYQIKRGQGLFIYPNIPHRYYSVDKPWLTHWVSFDGYSIETILDILNINKTGVYDILDSLYLENQLVEAFNLAIGEGLVDPIITSAYLYQLIVNIEKHTVPVDKEDITYQKNKLAPVLKYIEAHYFETITIDQLARLIHVTPQYLCVLFQRIVNKRPFEYINHVRINKSKALILADRNTSISTISNQVGFESPSYYGAQFKKIEGITPGAFRALFE